MNLLPSSSALAALCLLLPSPCWAQTVHVVDRNGGAGSSFTTIGAAVAAASDGDLVLVRRGSYPETVTLDGKGLNVQAEAGAGVGVLGITVRNLAANQRAAFRGIGRNSTQVIVTLADNQGAVWIEELGALELFTNVVAEVSACATVVLRSCTFKPINPGPAVSLLNSKVALYQCLAEGHDSGSSPFPISGDAGLAMSTSSATLYASSVTGGKGSDPVFGSLAGPGGPGCTLHGGSVLDVIGSSVQGGAGGTGGSAGPPYETSGGSVVHDLPFLPHLLSTLSPVREGATTSLTFVGHPGDRVYVIVGLAPGLYSTGSLHVGPLVIGPQRFNLSMGVLPGSGTKTVSFAMPMIARQTSPFYLQGLFLSSGELALGNATLVNVLDSAF